MLHIRTPEEDEHYRKINRITASYTHLFSLALASAITSLIPIPTSGQTCQEWKDQHDDLIQRLISRVGDEVTLNFPQTVNIARSAMTHRYAYIIPDMENDYVYNVRALFPGAVADVMQNQGPALTALRTPMIQLVMGYIADFDNTNA